MTTLGANAVTLQDWASRLDPKGKTSKIIEILSLTNQILPDMLWVEGNLPTGHRTTQRSSLPTVQWRALNEGVPVSKSKTIQVTDALGLMEAFSQIDEEIVNLNGNKSDFRLSEDSAYIEAMSNEMASTLFYGNQAVDPKEFTGFAPRYGQLGLHNDRNIFDAGGLGADNTSVWLVTWGSNTCHGIFPKGSKAGLQHNDLGIETVVDSNNNPYRAYMSQYTWKPGLSLRDWRYVVRVCNIDVSELTADASGSSANLIELMIRASHQLPAMGIGRPVYYVNRTTFTYLDLQTKNQTQMNITYDKDKHGQRVLMFRGIPVRLCESILDTESRVIA